MMKKIISAMAMLMCFQLAADDRAADYWSIGSFNKLINAISEKNRLVRETGLPVQVATFEDRSQSRYRLVVESDGSAIQKQELIDAGIMPWALPISVRQVANSDEALERAEILSEETDHFLVLAGFRAEFRAEAFQEKLSEDGVIKLQVEESSVSNLPWYRILHGPFSSAQASVVAGFRSRGITDAWWVHRESNMDPVREQIQEPDAAPVTVVAELFEVETQTKLNPPHAGDFYFDYCVKEANARERETYCKDGSLTGLLIAENKIKDEGVIGDERNEALAAYCALQASPEERDKYCED